MEGGRSELSQSLLGLGGEADATALGQRRVHELADGRHNGRNGLVMRGAPLLQARPEITKRSASSWLEASNSRSFTNAPMISMFTAIARSLRAPILSRI